MIRWPLSSRHLQQREVARGVACFARFDVAANGRGHCREPLGGLERFTVLLGYPWVSQIQISLVNPLEPDDIVIL